MKALATALLLLLLAPAARAADGPPAILLEVQVGRIPLQSGRFLSGFIDGWGPGIVAGRPLTDAIDQQISRPASATSGLLAEIEMAMGQIHAQKLARTGDWTRIIDRLEPLRARLSDNAGAIAADPKTRASAFEMQVLLLRAYEGMHRADATQKAQRLASELVVSFPDQQVTPSTRGPAFYDFYQSVKEREQRRRSYTLAVSARPAGCAIYGNERRIGTSPRALWQVPAGQYRIFVDCQNGRQSRVTNVDVNGDTGVGVDVRFDSALKTSGTQAMLFFRSDAARREREVSYASRIGRALKADRVVLLGIEHDPMSGEAALVGRVIVPADEVEIVEKGVALTGPPTAAQARTLGAQLLRLEAHPPAAPPARGTAKRIDLWPHRAPRVAAATRRDETAPARRLPWWPGVVAAGVGAAGVAVGAYDYAADGGGTCDAPAGVQCPRLHATRGAGIALISVGTALVAAGVLWAMLAATLH